jgi:hypothetical protein
MKAEIKSSIVVAMIFLFLCFITAAPANLWLLITAKSYTIPAESTIFSFEPTRMNNALGGSWIYAMDNERYYYQAASTADYYMLRKEDALTCEGFDANDFNTWCTQQVTLQRNALEPSQVKGSIGF